MRHTYILWLILLLPFLGYTQNCGLEDTLLINTNATHQFFIDVDGYFNDDLADPMQGVCGIELQFVHAFSENLELWITSPAGQQVQLIGPNTNDNGAFTFAAQWDIVFVPCAATAEPDSGYVAQWDNNQPNNFVIGGQYSGSYYPYIGCLEDFNTGPVNGAWTITAVNNPSAFYPGAIIDFRLLFCDTRGVECCFSNPGNLPDTLDLLVCEGDPLLQLDSLQPAYAQPPPDTLEYGYTYVLGEDGLLIGYDSLVDLSAFPPGNYEVCGLSYRRSDLDSLPQPDGVWTVDSLRNNLNSPLPLFCGELTDNCVEVIITPIPDTLRLTPAICEGDSITVADSVLVQEGFYQFILQSYGGCDSIVEVDLTVFPIQQIQLDSTICEGDSVTVGASVYKQSGLFVDTLTAVTGCDSIIELSLQVLEPDTVSLSQTICMGDTAFIGDIPFVSSGNHQVTLTSSQGCDSTVFLQLTVLDPQAVIAPPDTLTCAQTQVLLDGEGAAPAGLAYAWFDSENNGLGTAVTQPVTLAGTYRLVVTQSQGGAVCTDTAQVSVPADLTPPLADAGPPDTLTCDRTEVDLGGPGTSTGDDFAYAWTTTDGQLTGPADTALTTATAPGLYFLTVTDLSNGCFTADSVSLAIDTIAPVADAGPGRVLTCANTTVTLDGSNSSTGSEFTYAWKQEDGVPVPGGDDLLPVVSLPGIYRLLVTDTGNGCVDSATVAVTIDTLAPVVDIGPPGLLNCAVTTLLLDASASDAGPDFNLLWRTSNGGNIISGASTLTPEVNQPGDYELLIINLTNGCRDSLTVTVIDTLTAVQAVISGDTMLNCSVPSLTLDGSASLFNPDVVFAWSSPDGSILGDTASVSIEADAPGVYELILTDTVTFCADTASVTVVQDILTPVADAGPGFELNCTVTQDTLDGRLSAIGPAIVYAWSGPCLVTNPDSAWVIVDCPGVYFLTVTDESSGCSAVDSVTVNLNDTVPLADAGPSDTLTCQQPELTLDGSASGQGPAITYQWTGPGIVSGETSLSPQVNVEGTYTLIVRNTENTCADTATVLIALDTLHPLVDTGLPGLLTCAAPMYTVGGPGTDTGPAFQYSWTTLNGSFTGATDSVTAVVDTAGTYMLEVTNLLNGCSSLASVEVTEDQEAPAAEAGTDQVLNCSQTVVTLDGSASATGLEFTYQWSGPCLEGAADGLQVQATCGGTYFLTVFNTANGCAATDSVLVTLDDAMPVAEAGEPDTLTCAVTELTLDGSASSQGPHLMYAWSGPGITAGSGTLTPLVDAPGTYTLMVTDTVNTCFMTDTVLVEEDILPPVADTGPTATLTCDVDTVTLGGPGTTMGPDLIYEWLTVEGNIIGPSDQPVIQTDTSGVYVFFVTNTANGCADTSFVNVTIDREAPFVDAGGPAIISCGDPVATLEGTATTGGAAIQYTWSGPYIAGPANDSLVLVDGPGIFYLTATNLINGCSARDSVGVTLAPETPLAALPDTVFLSCQTGETTLDASGSTPGPVVWFYEGTPAPLNGLTPVVDQAGVYELIVANLAEDCFDTARVEVILDCDPQLAVLPPDTITCAQTIIELSTSVSPSGVDYEYQWQTSATGCTIGATNEATLTINCGGSYTLIVTNPVLGLSDTVTVEVAEDKETPLADAGEPDTLICTEPFLTVGGPLTSTGPEFVYIWTDFNQDTMGFDPTLQVTVPDTYFLEVIDTTNGCADDDFVIISEILGGPEILFGSTVFPCDQDTFGLQLFLDPPDPGYLISWAGPGIVGGADSLTVLIDTVGTYEVTIVNPVNDCVTSAAATVTEQICGPCLNIAPPDTLTCAVQAVTLQGSFCEPCTGCTFNWTSIGGTFDSGEGTFTPVVTAPGIYILSATDTLGFTSSLEVTVVELTTPPPALAGPDQIITCATPEVILGDTTGISTDAYSYSWSSLNGAPISPTDQALAAVSEPGAFVVRVEDLFTGCLAMDTVVVTLDTLAPVADAGPGRLLTCDATLVSLDGAGSSLGLNFEYQWTTQSSGNISGATTLDPVVSVPGVYYLEVRNANNGCTAMDSTVVSLSVDLPPLPDIADAFLNCADTVAELVGALPAPSGYSFEWCEVDAAGTPLACQSADLVLTVNQPGSFRFALTNDSTGCTSQLTVAVEQDTEVPLAEAGAADTLLCNLDSLVLAGEAGPVGMSLEYLWTSASGNPVGQATTLTPTVYTPDTYYLQVTNTVNQCTARDSVHIVADNNAPSAYAGADTLLTCAVTALRLSGEAVSGGDPVFQWSTFGGNFLADSLTATPLIDEPGSYFLTVTDLQNGCTAADTVLVLENRLQPEAQLPDTASLMLNCVATSLELDGSTSIAANGEGLTYQWMAGPGGHISGGDPATAVIEVDQPADYQLVVTDNFNGCRDTLAVTVGGDFELPQVSIETPLPLTCVRTTTQVVAEASSSGPAFTNRWTDENDMVLPDTTLVLTAEEAATYFLTITNQNNGCLATGSVTVGIDTLSPVAVVETPAGLDCDVLTVTLNGSGSSQGTSIGFTWQTEEGEIVAGEQSAVAVAGAPGLYTLTVENNTNGCADSITVEVLELSAPITGVSLTVTPASCYGAFNGSIRVDSVSGGTGPFYFALDDSIFIAYPEFNNLLPGSYTLRVLDADGCEWTEEVVMPAPEEVAIDLGPDTTINLGDSLLLEAMISSESFSSVRWTPAGLPGDTLSQWVTPLETTTYSATVVNADGCTATDWITVSINRPEAVFVPTVFSPDGDGINDLLMIFGGADVAAINRFIIFDRWGNKVFGREQFQPNDPVFGWDGKFNGRPMNAAVYVYYLEVAFVDGRVKSIAGDVVLVR